MKNVWKAAFDAYMEDPEAARADPYFRALGGVTVTTRVGVSSREASTFDPTAFKAWLRTPVALGTLMTEQDMPEDENWAEDQMVYRVIFTPTIYMAVGKMTGSAKRMAVLLRDLEGWTPPGGPRRINTVTARWWTRDDATTEEIVQGWSLRPWADDGMDLV